MNLHEKQITDLENEIQRFRNYKNIFRIALYNSCMKRSNHKELKKELIKLKRMFLDKEFIENEDKPQENNYESMRKLYEGKIFDLDMKLKNNQGLFAQEHSKLMRENMNLIIINNLLEKEKKAIEENSQDLMSENAKVAHTKQKKDFIPKVNKVLTPEDKMIEELKEEIMNVEKQIQFVRESKKKEVNKDK